MKMHLMRKTDVLRVWSAMILDVRASKRRSGRTLGPCTAKDCVPLLSLLRASVRVGNLCDFSISKAKAWAEECAEMVRKGEAP